MRREEQAWGAAEAGTGAYPEKPQESRELGKILTIKDPEKFSSVDSWRRVSFGGTDGRTVLKSSGRACSEILEAPRSSRFQKPFPKA